MGRDLEGRSTLANLDPPGLEVWGGEGWSPSTRSEAFAGAGLPHDRIRTMVPSGAVLVMTTREGDPATLHPEEMMSLPGGSPKRWREFAAGRACARRAMSELSLPEGPVRRSADRTPMWPPGMVGSISHCPGLVAAIVAPSTVARGVGVDVERALLAASLRPLVMGVQKDAFSAFEAIYGSRALAVAFSTKEAAFKATYPLHGQMLGFDDIWLWPSLAQGHVKAVVRLPAMRDAQMSVACELAVGPRYVMCLALVAND